MNKKILTLVIVGLVGLPMAAAASTLENHGVVTGHTTYANMGGFDPNIAAIAGLAESKVVWFNGQTIFSTTGEGFVYATKANPPCSPLQGTNFTFQENGYQLSYIDPNNQSHIVAHYTYRCNPNLFDTGNLADHSKDFIDRNTGGNGIEHHVWVTVTHTKLLDGPIMIQNTGGTVGDDGRLYNFALAVDTLYFRDKTDDGSVVHGSQGGRTTDEINEGDSYCEEDDDHVCNDGSVDGEDGADPHEHNSAQVDLWFGKVDRGIGAAKVGGGTHAGTQLGCSTDAHCNGVVTGTYEDPTATSP